MSEIFKGRILQSVYGYDYSSRGGEGMTYEDVKRIRDNPKIEECDGEELSRLIDEAVDKQIERKGKNYHKYYAECPVCGSRVYTHMKYCVECGQKLKWGDEY